MMDHRERAKDGDERDAVSRVCRRVLVFFGRPGVARAIKTRMSRRVRREAKLDLRRSPPLGDCDDGINNR